MEKRLDDMTQVSGDTSTSKELCLLSLDGGGIKGLSSLLILRRLMENINPANPPKPYEHFDMICGTSTGGLIAIMLGRLRLSVQECIDEYLKLSPPIFVKTKHRLKVDASVQGRFDHEAFERGIRTMLAKYGFSEDALFREEHADPPCKVYTHRGVVILSNYYSDRRDSELWSTAKIWEVARATSAAPTFFDPVIISGERFGDGALRANNPVQELEEEARDVWGRRDPVWNFEANVRCLVSVGTGKLALEPFHETFWGLKILDSLQGILTETEDTANHFHKIHTDLFQKNQAFRFNVDQGLEEVGLEEINKIDNVKALTRKYLSKETVYIALGNCVQQLKDRGWVSKMINLARSHSLRVSSKLELTPVALDLFSSCSHTSEYQAWDQKGTVLVYNKVKSGLKAEQNQKSASYIAARLINNGYPQSNYVPKVYYVHCRPLQGARDNLEGDASSTIVPTRIDEILRSLTLQALNEGREAFLARYMESIKGGKSLEELLGSRDQLDHDTMKHHFISHIQALSTSAIIAVDNVDDAENGCGVRLVRDLVGHFRDLDDQIKFVVSASRPHALSFGVPVAFVWDSLEYLECLEILRREIQENRRREDISDAEPGTADWIWDHQSYKSWESMPQCILWIEGKPGSGKSVLAKSISSKYKKILEAERDQRYRDGEDHSVSERGLMLLSDWYYSTRGNTTAQDHKFLFQALLFQWLQQNPAIFKLLASEYRKKEPLSESWISAESLKNTIQKVVGQEIPILSIVDAMDESENRRDSEIRRQDVLQSFLKMVAESPDSKAKFIITSRPSTEIEDQFLKPEWHKFVRRIKMQENNFGAISKIIDAGMASLKERMEKFSGREQTVQKSSSSWLPDDPADSEKFRIIRSYLVDNADGVILWVTVIIKTLSSLIENGGDSFAKLEKELRSLPTDLSELYKQIVDDLCTRLSLEEVSETRRTLMWVSRGSLLGPLPLGALYEAIPISSLETTNLGDDSDPIFGDKLQSGNWYAFRRRLRLRCGPFLDVITAESRNHPKFARKNYHPTNTIQLLHRTVKDFLNNPKTTEAVYFTDDMATAAVGEDKASYLSILERGFEHSMRYEGSGTLLKTRRKAIDGILHFFEKRMLFNFLCQSDKLNLDTFPQCAHYILARLAPLNPEVDKLNSVPWSTTDISLRKSLLERLDPSDTENVGEIFAKLIQSQSIRLGTSPIYVKLSAQLSWEEKYLLELIFAELTYQACINGLPNAASILVNLWVPKDDGSTYLAQQRSAQRCKLAIVAFLVSLQHGPTAICRRMWALLNDTCIDWVCGLWHVRQKKYPGISPDISLAEKLAIESGHVEIIADLASKSWLHSDHDTEILEKRLEADRARKRQLSPILLSAFVLVLFGPLVLVLWLMEYLLGGSLLRYEPFTSQESKHDTTRNGLRQNLMTNPFDHSFDHISIQQQSSVTPSSFKRGDGIETNTTTLKEKAVEVRQRNTTGQENAIRDQMMPSPSIMEALTIVTKHDLLRKTDIIVPRRQKSRKSD